MFTKVLAIVIREIDQKVLVHKMDVPGYTWLRLPGGGVENGELFVETVARELLEEAGLAAETLEIGRNLGTLRYISQLDGQPRERHCFLVHTRTALPEQWDYVVSGDGDDAEMVFHHFWLGYEDFSRIDPTLRPILTPEIVPELFPSA